MPCAFVSSVIPAPPKAVWSVIRDFNGLPQWHPAVVESFIEHDQNAAAVGCIRRFKQRSGDVIRERLDALDDRLHVQCYSIIQAPLPATNYRARISCGASRRTTPRSPPGKRASTVPRSTRSSWWPT